MNCTNCNHSLSNNAKFCSKCGTPVQTSTLLICPSCHTENDQNANFCLGCQYAFKAPSQEQSVVDNGTWKRLPSEIVRKIAPKEMEKAFSLLPGSKKTIDVPMGSICAVVENGSVVDILPPGRRTTQGWFTELMEQFSSSNSSAEFYFITRQLIAFPLSVTTKVDGQNATQTSKVLISGNVAHTFNNPDHITTFLRSFVAERTSLSLLELQQQLLPQLDAVVQHTAQTSTVKTLPRAVEQGLQFLEQSSGLSFSVRITPSASAQNLSFHFGLVDIPSQAECRSCKREVQLGSRFCIHCKAPQTLRPSKASKTESVPMVTKDGQHIELDVSIRINGVKPLYTGNFEFGQNLANATADAIRKSTLAELTQPASLQLIEQEITTRLEQSLANHTVERCTVLDIRSKKEDWLFKTKADMEQVRLELNATKQWLDIGAEEHEMEVAVQEFIANRAETEREQSLVALAAQLEFQRKQDALQLEDKQIKATNALSAAEANFLLEQRRDALREQQDEHDGTQTLKANERQHALDQMLAGLKQDQRIEAFKRDTAYNRMVQAYQQEDLIKARQQELEGLEHQQTVADQKQVHAQNQATTAQDHNLAMQGKQNAFQNNATIAQAQTNAEVAAINLNTEMSGLEARDALAAKQRARKLDEQKELREQDRIDKKLDAQIAQDLLNSKQTHEQTMMEARHRLAQSLEGKSVGELMMRGAIAAGRALTDGESAALAKIESGEDATRAEMLAQFVEKNGTEHTQMLTFFEKMMATAVQATATAATAGSSKTEAPPTQDTTCATCNTNNPAGSVFCQGCGTNL